MELNETAALPPPKTVKSIFTFKLILKIIAITGIFLSCFYMTISIFFWISASFRGLSMINAIFGGITFLTFLYFYFSIYTTKRVYFYNVLTLLAVMFVFVFLISLLNLLHTQKISDAAIKLLSSNWNVIKNDINVQYFINACMSILLCGYMILSMIFVSMAHENGTGYEQSNSRNPTRSIFFMMSL